MRREKAIKVLKVELVLLVIFSMGLFRVTSAFLSSMDYAENKFSIGYSDCEIVSDADWEKVDSVLTKTYSITNTGTVPCYIRIYAALEYNPEDELKSVNSLSGKVSLEGASEICDLNTWSYSDDIISPGESLECTARISEVDEIAPSANSTYNIPMLIFAESAQSEGSTSPEDAFGKID